MTPANSSKETTIAAAAVFFQPAHDAVGSRSGFAAIESGPFAEAESVSPLYWLANSKLQFVAFLGAKLERRRSPPDCCSYDRRSIKNLTAD
jgi:hypothetical protein